jgi:hypothetical protein
MARAKSLFHSANHAINFLARSAAKKAATEQLRDQVRSQSALRSIWSSILIVSASVRTSASVGHDRATAPDDHARRKTALSVEQVAQSRALKRLNNLVQLLRFSDARAYYLRTNAQWAGSEMVSPTLLSMLSEGGLAQSAGVWRASLRQS